MKKTVGPMDLRSSFMAYNSKGMPMGVAVVAFVRNGDAVKARKSYHGKVIDGSACLILKRFSTRVHIMLFLSNICLFALYARVMSWLP